MIDRIYVIREHQQSQKTEKIIWNPPVQRVEDFMKREVNQEDLHECKAYWKPGNHFHLL